MYDVWVAAELTEDTSSENGASEVASKDDGDVGEVLEDRRLSLHGRNEENGKVGRYEVAPSEDDRDDT